MACPGGGNGWTLGTRVHQGAKGPVGSPVAGDGPPMLGASSSGGAPVEGVVKSGVATVGGPPMLGASDGGTVCCTGVVSGESGVRRWAEGAGESAFVGGCLTASSAYVKPLPCRARTATHRPRSHCLFLPLPNDMRFAPDSFARPGGWRAAIPDRPCATFLFIRPLESTKTE